ncbi:MAG: metallophosphoesterase family protein [Methanothrix sp.]
MTTILALSDTCLVEGRLNSEIARLAGEADLVLHAGDITSQATYDALKKACKKYLWAVYGEKDPKDSLEKPILKDSAGNLIPEFKSGTLDSVKIYLKNNPCKSEVYSESELMTYADDEGIDLMVFGHFNKPIIAWGQKYDRTLPADGHTQLLVCPGSSSTFKSSFPTVVRINIFSGKINNVELIYIPPAKYQDGWRRCSKCQGLFYSPNVKKSICPEGGEHSPGTTRYSLAYDSNSSGQRDWRWCSKCQGLYFGPNIKESKCPNGGNHVNSGSRTYTIIKDNPNVPSPSVMNWRWCGKCQGLFYVPYAMQSNCPAGGKHVIGSSNIRSGVYTLEFL